MANPNAVTIAETHLELFPNVEHFFNEATCDKEIEKNRVSPGFTYPKSVGQNKSFKAHGVFFNYFTRKHLSLKYKINIIDKRAEAILGDDIYILERRAYGRSMSFNYKVFKDNTKQALDIIESIKIVSFAHLLFFREQVPNTLEINRQNLLEVMKHLNSLPYKEVLLNPCVGCEYFNADANLIFDKNTIYSIKTSKFELDADQDILRKAFFRPILYSLGFYKECNVKILKFVIYNPLLGLEYTLLLNDLNFETLEKALKLDLDNFHAEEEEEEK